MITTHGLCKKFGSVLAVDHIDLDVRAGDVYGFLGANGSGKTTSVRMILGLIMATSGEIELLGEPMPRRSQHVLPRVGTLVEGPAAYGHLSARTNLSLFDASGGRSSTRKSRVDDALEQVGLSGTGRKPVKAFSLGMRQRLGLAGALLQKPELLVLDEPTNGLDPQGIREIRELLLKLNADGTTIFLSSHLLAEIERMCTRVGVLDRGRLILQDELSVLQAPTGRTVVRTSDPTGAARVLQDRIEQFEDDRLVVRGGSAADVNELLVAAGIPVDELAPERQSLEELILARTSMGTDRMASP